METQDHKNPNLSGNEVHGGVHVCHKCGWPYPNHHPSSKQRRTHKKVCGTIDGYRFDNDAHSSTRVEGADGEDNSDDELQIPSEKVVERTISRRSSSGVGSKSSRSARSEEDVFTDAVTEFNESSGTVTGEASDGVMQRYYSMQNGNELDDTETTEESSTGADNLSTPDLLKDDKLQTFQRVEVENNKLEAGVRSQDSISTSLVSAVVASEIENAVDQNMIQSSEPSRELDIVSERGKDIISSKDESDVRSSYTETPEEVAEVVSIPKGSSDEVKGFNDEALDSVSAGGFTKATLMETAGVEDNNGVDVSEKDKSETHHEVNSPGNSYYPVLQVRDIDSINSNIKELDLVEECDLMLGANENVYALPVLNPEIAVGKDAKDSSDVSMEYSKAFVVEEGGLDIDFTKTGDNDRVLSEDVDLYSVVDKQEDSEKSVDEHAIQEPDQQMSDANSSNVDINTLRSDVVEDLKSENSEEKEDIYTKQKKPSTSQENTFPEGVTMDAGHIQETTSNADFDHKDEGEHFTVLDSDGSKFSANTFAVGNSMFAEPAIHEVPTQDLELINTPNNGKGDVDNIAVEAAILNGQEMSGGVAENVSTEIGPASGLSIGGSDDSLDRSTETDKNAGVLDKILDSGDIVITNDHLSSTSNLKVEEDAEHSRQSSAVVNQCSNEKLTEETSCTTEGDGVNKQHVAVPANDAIVDSSSVADSLDGNWGSVSVMSAISDAQPTTDSIASNLPRALEGEEILVMVPTPEMENRPSLNQISVKPEVGIEQVETVSEIQTSKEQHQINSAVQTGLTPTVADVANEPVKGKKDKEIIAKVANWDSGKQHGPLKTLLGEATARSRAESPIHHNQSPGSTPMPQYDLNTGTKNGPSANTENVLNFDHPEMDASQEEMGKEWNSPARYPVNIKSEKKRSKSKPYWTPFFCCSSVNAR